MTKHHNYFVYILTNKNKTVLYVGVTNDLKGRLYQHITEEVKGFTYKYNCHYLVYYERFDYINDAIAREKEIKGWTRKKKEKLIESFNPEWKFYNDEVLEEQLSF